MKLKSLYILLLTAVMAVGCYNKFDTPAPQSPLNDTRFEAMFPEAEHISIAELKYAFGELSNTGTNKDWATTKYKLIGEDIFEGHDVYIKGKVISDDNEGNIYKSLHIQDETSAIELKLNNSVNVRYKYGSWVYVRLTGLYLGNYRMMLSLGGAPTESYNKAQKHRYYANSNIELQEVIDRHVFAGEASELTVGSFAEWKSDPASVDIITITPENYKEALNVDMVECRGSLMGVDKTSADGKSYKSFSMRHRELMLGRLIRFEGLTCRYAGVPNQDGVTPPVIRDGSYTSIYPSWIYTDLESPISKGWYHWAFKEDITGRSLYGSVLFAYDLDTDICSADGLYTLRSSGYSRFARQNICKDGERATITAIYSIYATQSNFKGNEKDYAKYQLAVSRYADIEFESGDAALLTDEQVAAMTTEDMKNVPWIDEKEGESEM